MSISEWGKGALVAAFAGPEIAFLLPSGTATLGELPINSRNEVRPQSSVGELNELLSKRLVLAVGVSQGRIIDETLDSTRSQFWVRRAGDVLAVSEPAFRLWEWTLVPRSVEEFEARVKEVCGPEPDSQRCVRELEGLSLITTFGPDLSEWHALAEKLRPIPLGFGLGNSEVDILQYEIADRFGLPALRVQPIIYWIWLTWDGTLSIGQAADELITHLPAEATREVIVQAARELALTCVIRGVVVLDVVSS